MFAFVMFHLLHRHWACIMNDDVLLAQDYVGAAAARGWDCWAAESSEWHASLPLSGAWTRAPTIRREWPT